MADPRQPVSPPRAKLRCAVYTRKSSEEGLEQEFNSLDAQREACQAYVASQRHEGWIALPALYDDGAYSGGTMERPALQRMLEDIRARRIDVVVVYKVDRLTRSLADFAKIVEVFDAQGVSFVSVTQAFNTTSSMGRLTLNVLLSFAQFEREVTGERIRDKIAASKRKGMWMGGQPPLGYEVKERKLIVNEPEAATVREIFRRYLELGAVRALRDDLAASGIVSKRRIAADGSPYGGKVIARGALYLMLKNPIYRGQIVHKDKVFPGEHAAIVDEELWRTVQDRLDENRLDRREGDGANEPSLLAGVAFDATSQILTPTHAVKKGTRYRYYVSRRLITGTVAEGANGQRLPAAHLETLVIGRLRALLADPIAALNAIASADRDAPIQKRLRDAAASLSARWESLSRERLHNLTRGKLVRVQVHADRIDLDVDAGRLIERLLNEGGGGIDAGHPDRDRAATRVTKATAGPGANASGSPSVSANTIADDNKYRGTWASDNAMGDGSGHAHSVDEPLIRLTIPASLKRAGMETKFIVDGVETSTPMDATLIKLILRGRKISKRVLEPGCPTLEDIATEERIGSSYAIRLVRLTFLAPDIVACDPGGQTFSARRHVANSRGG